MNEKTVLGMSLFIVSEATFFIFLILAYVYFLHGSAVSGPTPASSLDRGRTGVYTIVLLSSSLTTWFAEKSHAQAQRWRQCLWLGLTIVLGAVFLCGQGLEYTHLFQQNVTVERNLFGATFFTLTGFHGLHVLLGLVALTILLGLVGLGENRDVRSSAVRSVSLYWHFVDVVWIVIFSIIYLWSV